MASSLQRVPSDAHQDAPGVRGGCKESQGGISTDSVIDVAGAMAVLALILFTLPAPAFADRGRSPRYHGGEARHPRYHGSGRHGGDRYSGGQYSYRGPGGYYAPPARYHYSYPPPARYYAPPAPYYYTYYPPYYPGVDVRVIVPFPFFSFYLW
jgi:hypothetical protein